MKDKISKAEIERAFKLLGERADREHFQIELFIMGGAAIIFAYPEAEVKRNGLTHDVDAVFVQPMDQRVSQLRSLIGSVQSELDLAAGWLNDSVTKFVERRSDGPVVFESRGILVRRATDLQLLGSKLGLERRQTDLDDQVLLFEKVCQALTPISMAELWSWIEKYVPATRKEAARDKLEELWDAKDS